jgi:hypothetical protein
MLVLLVALGTLAGGTAHTATAGPARAARGEVASTSGLARELSYIASAQSAGGGFGEAGGRRSSELYSAWVAMGLAAAGEDPLSVKHAGHSVLDALRAEASTLEGVGDVERTILALHACGVPAQTLGALHLEAMLLAARRPDGSFSDQVNLTAFAIFALRAEGRPAGARVLQGAARWIIGEQDTDGGFGFATRGSGSETDDTAAAVQAIIAAGSHPRSALRRALAYIVHAQNPDGGFPEGAGGESNAQSTAWAVQGLVAAGRDVEALTREGGRSPLEYLRSLVAPDGSVRYSRTSSQTPVWVTAQALIALARKPFPVGPVRSRGAGARSSSTAGGSSAATTPGRPSLVGSPRSPGQATATAGKHAATRAASIPGVGASDASAVSALYDAVAGGLTSVAQRALVPIGVAAGHGAPGG